jgi:hypothetical protein
MKKIPTVMCCVALIAASAQAAGPVQFSCTAAGQSFSSDSFPIFQVAKGASEYVMSQKYDMLMYERTEADGSKSWSSKPVDGSKQMIEAIPPSEPITLIVSLGAEIPKMPGKFLQVSVSVKAVTRSALAKLPLTVPVQGRGKGQGTHASLAVQYAGGIYEGTAGEVVVEAVDFKAKTIRGRFSAETKNPGFGTAPAGPMLKIEAGKFNLIERQ